MEREKVKEIIGQFGLFDLNGSKKHKKKIHGVINTIGRTQAFIERNQGEDIIIHFKDIEDFKPIEDKRDRQRVCPVCLKGKINLNGSLRCDICKYELPAGQVEELRAAPELIE